MSTRRNKQRQHQERGMTLLELMIAAGIMAVGLVAIFGSLLSLTDTSNLSEERSAGMAQVGSLVEDFRTMSYDDMMAYEPPPITGVGAGAVEVRCYYSDGSYVTLPTDEGSLPEPLPNPCQVQLKLKWEDKKGRPMEVSASMWHRR